MLVRTLVVPRRRPRSVIGGVAMTRKQCKGCPWKVGVDPTKDIPQGYCKRKHQKLEVTIAPEGRYVPGPLRMMSCHETPTGAEQPCVGWLVNQLGDGNNIGLRLHCIKNRGLTDVETVGPQHATFKDTLP